MPEHPDAPEQRTIDVDVRDIDTRGRMLVGYAAVYGAESGDLGGFSERVAPGAFRDVLASPELDVRALLNHDPNAVLGRSRSGTLRLADDERGLRFELDLPESPLGENVRASVARGDIDGASFRFRVGRDTWEGSRRTVETVAHLADCSVATFGAYPAASVELRTRPAVDQPLETAVPENETDNRSAPEPPERRGTLSVAQRPGLTTSAGHRGLADAFRTNGFPGETASVPFDEFRAATFTGTADALSPLRVNGVNLGADQRYAWVAFGLVGVAPGDTSVQVLSQSARTLPATASMIRNIDAVTAKPEVDSVLAILNVPLKQVAAIEKNVPNVYLEQPVFNSVIENDLRLALNEALDKLVLDAVAASGFQVPGTDALLVSIRKAMTTILASGYSPDTLILTPANAEELDVLVSGISGGTNDYVFGAGAFAPGTIFGLNKRISKTAAVPFVADSRALGKLYASPIRLARFEVDAGATNRSNVRLEGSAVFGVERQDAAVRIAAS